MPLIEHLKLTASRIILSSFLFLYFLFGNGLIDSWFWSSQGVSLFSMIVLFFLDAVMAYLLSCYFVFSISTVFKTAKNLLKYTDVISFKVYLWPLLVSFFLTCAFIFLRFAFSNILDIQDFVAIKIITFLACICATIFLIKKDYFTERITWFSILYSGILTLIHLGAFFYFGASLSYLFGPILIFIVLCFLIGYCVALLINFIRNPYNMFSKKILLLNLIVILYLLFESRLLSGFL